MPWKIEDDSKNIVLQDGNPVFVFDNAESKSIDPAALHAQIGSGAKAVTELTEKYSKAQGREKDLALSLGVEWKEDEDNSKVIIKNLNDLKSKLKTLSEKEEDPEKETEIDKNKRFSQEEFDAALQLKTSELSAGHDNSSGELKSSLEKVEIELKSLKTSARETGRLLVFYDLYKTFPDALVDKQAQAASLFSEQVAKSLPDGSKWQQGPVGDDGKCIFLLHDSEGNVSKNADGKPVVSFENFMKRFREDNSLLFNKVTQTDKITKTGNDDKDVENNRIMPLSEAKALAAKETLRLLEQQTQTPN